MELREERELKQIRETFTRAIDLFRQRQYKAALPVFEEIIQEYEGSQYYSIVEIENRSRVYKKICEAQLNPVKIELHDDEDYLYDGIYHLNAGNPDKALERFNYLKDKEYKDPYLKYLVSLSYLKKEDVDTCLDYLEEAVSQDEYYKIIAYNEPDFDMLVENQRFSALIDTEIEENE
jgi:tetratricopeptide (TPR) repeat protein